MQCSDAVIIYEHPKFSIQYNEFEHVDQYCDKKKVELLHP